TAPEDWLSCFDFGDLPLSSSTQEVDHLSQLLDFDISDLLLPPIENPPPNDNLLLRSPGMEPDADGNREESDGFFSILKLDGRVDHLAGVQEAADDDSSPLKSDSFTKSSTHESDTGSSLAMREKENCEDNLRDIS
ncbi:hypothetical protein L7F22_013966, partial [Adiantum nelumboides]|nr:hypothetical protein [Adiantum nelumboides]